MDFIYPIIPVEKIIIPAGLYNIQQPVLGSQTAIPSENGPINKNIDEKLSQMAEINK